jgi:hypothetical protein
MNAKEDPKRWSAEGSGAPRELQDLLRQARNDLPSTTELAAMGLFTPHVPGPISGTSQGASTGTSTSGTISAAKVALIAKIGAVGLGLAGAGVWWVASSEAIDQSGSTESQPRATTPMAAAPTQQRAEQPDPARAEPSPEEITAPALASTPIATSARNDARGPAEASKALPSEASLLERAQTLLRSDPARALALAERHATLYPSGHLVQEREVIRIEALRKLGRTDQAAKAGRDFARDFPDSAHKKKIEDSVP